MCAGCRLSALFHIKYICSVHRVSLACSLFPSVRRIVLTPGMKCTVKIKL